uniref:Ubiquitin-like domain-containing protein n=1 Tax=viral metagenome TaxID=1070528 RepID=A0A6M3LPZ5_9ZZZZ
MKVKITLNNAGGPLDTQVINVNPLNVDDNPVKDKLNEMLDGIDLAPGDTIFIEEA